MAREVAPDWTVDWGVKPVPVTVIVVSALPAKTVLGERDETVGAGLTTCTVADPEELVLAVLVAVMVTVLGEGGTAGAV